MQDNIKVAVDFVIPESLRATLQNREQLRRVRMEDKLCVGNMIVANMYMVAKLCS